MAELPLETEETASDLPEGLIPPEIGDDGDAEPVETLQGQVAPASYGPVVLRERYLIDPGKPIVELDTPSAKAYVVEDGRDLSSQLYGLVCTPGLPVRLNDIKALKIGHIDNILPIIDWDSIYWPALGQKTVVVVFVRPLGGRVTDKLAQKEIKINEYDMPQRVIAPLADALEKLSNMDQAYRAIRPDNLLFLDERMEEIVLGPHVTAPAGYDQPVLLEPLDRAMAQSAGRGIGDARDDIYALGVTILLLLLGYNPVAKMKDDELLKARLEHGSYMTICGSARIPMQLIEPLRGMLADDASERWDFNEISNWLTGQKINHLKKRLPDRSETYFKFRSMKHYSAQSLAWHFAKHPNDAVMAINTEEFQIWMTRGLDEPEKAEAIYSAVHAVKFNADSYQGTDDYLVAQATAIMDPHGPIRYKGLAFMPDGYGAMLASEWIRNSNQQPAGEVLSHDICALWYDAQPKMTKELLDSQMVINQLRSVLAIRDPGYGLERVLYEGNPGISCQSPYVAKDGVVLIEHLLPALDNAANSVDTSVQPVDGHVAAFVAARFDEDIQPHLKAMASGKADTSILGTLSLLAFMQSTLRTPDVLGLSSWIGGLLGPAINAYHNRQTREELERDIPRLVRKGSLPELVNLINDPAKRQEDKEGFTACCAEWLDAEVEIRDIEDAGEERLNKAEQSGQQAAAMISIFIALTVITVLIIAEIL